MRVSVGDRSDMWRDDSIRFDGWWVSCLCDESLVCIGDVWLVEVVEWVVWDEKVE